MRRANVDETAAERDHGIGLLSDWAEEGAKIEVAVSSADLRYELIFGFALGRIDALAGEALSFQGKELIRRRAGSDRADFHHLKMGQRAQFTLRVPERISLSHYLDYNAFAPANELK